VSENDLPIQIECVVRTRIAARTRDVIVGRTAIEARVSGVLRAQLQILPRPEREVRNVSRASRISISAAGHRTRSIQSSIHGTPGIKHTERARIAIADMVLGIGQHSIQMMGAIGRRTRECAGHQVRVFVNKCAPKRKRVAQSGSEPLDVKAAHGDPFAAFGRPAGFDRSPNHPPLQPHLESRS
jgi:hypothetical protein